MVEQRWWFGVAVMVVLGAQWPNNGSSGGVLVGVEGAAAVPAIFVFGDSLVDDGNNNFINSIAKSNYYPYGCDFNRGPSGRFSNGKTFSDLLGTLTP